MHSSIGLGFIIAFIALVLCIVFGAMGRLDMIVALLIGLVALSRLLS